MLDFKSSAGQSIGVEIEFQILDPVTFDLVNGILPLMELCSGNPYIVPEYEQSTVEINSKICGNIKEIEQNVFFLASTIREKCRDLGMVISGGGTHPFCRRFVKVTPTPRFLAIEKAEGYLGYTSNTYALHVHVGMSTGEETIAVMKSLRPYLPVLLTLSANSPFWWGHDSGYACFRQRVLSASRDYGIPPVFESWKDFSDFSESASRAGVFTSFEDIHWDIRPRPDIGTLEIRVMDSQSTIREAVILTSFIHVLVEYIRKKCAAGKDEEGLISLPLWAERENHFRATRRGIGSLYIMDYSGNTRPIRGVIEDTIEAVAGTAEEMGEGEYLRQLGTILDKGPGYLRQRRIFKESGSLEEVSASLASEMEQDLELFRAKAIHLS